jgi:hypothetical protein
MNMEEKGKKMMMIMKILDAQEDKKESEKKIKILE